MFSGAFTALVTPFRNDEVDVEALEGLVEFQIKGGVSGLVPCGTTAETPALSEAEDRLEQHRERHQVHQDGRGGRRRRLPPGRPVL